MKEYEIIKTIKSVVDTDLNLIGDDTAVIPETGAVYTCDTLVENTHFRLETTSFFDLGYKAAAVNLSDIAAAGGIGKYLLVSLALPSTISLEDIKEFYTGMKSLTDQFETAIIGGDLTKSPILTITVTAIGETTVKAGRTYAKSGQSILTTGFYGASFAGLSLLESAHSAKKKKSNEDTHLDKPAMAYLKEVHKRPFPRIKEVQRFLDLSNYKTYCLMDTSDGLADALFQLSQRSNVRLNVDTALIPINRQTRDFCHYSHQDPLDMALYGGEDFQIILTCEKSDEKILLEAPLGLTKIGHVSDKKSGVTLVYENGTSIELTEDLLETSLSFKHF